jgi:hypothetical protein
MMDVLWVEFSLPCVLLGVKSTVGNVVPACFSLVGEQHVGAVLPFEPPPELLRKHPDIIIGWTFMKPVVVWAFPLTSPGVDVSWEFTLKTGDDIIELKGVGGEMDPSGVSGENGEGLAWPKTVVLVPAGNVWLAHGHVASQVRNVELPSDVISLDFEVLLKDASPLGAGNLLVEVAGSALHVDAVDSQAVGSLNVRVKFLVSFIEPVVKGSAVEIDNSGTSVQVVDGGGEGDLCTESVSS